MMSGVRRAASLPWRNVQSTRDCAPATRRAQRDRLRDQAAHRMAGEMKAVETLGVGDGEHVGGHVFDRQRAGAESAAADPRLSGAASE